MNAPDQHQREIMQAILDNKKIEIFMDNSRYHGWQFIAFSDCLLTILDEEPETLRIAN